MKRLTTCLLILFCLNTAFSQRVKKEKIEALKIAFITQKLDLTSKEAQQFWPIYNESQEKIQKLRKASRKLHSKTQQNLETITEKEATVLLAKTMKIQQKIHEEETALVHRLKKVLSAKKIILLKKAGHEFKKTLLRKFRNHKGSKPPTPPMPPEMA